MSKKRFLLRLTPELYKTLEKWAADDLRSVNAQIEFLLTQAVKQSGRHKLELESREPSEGAVQPPSES